MLPRYYIQTCIQTPLKPKSKQASCRGSTLADLQKHDGFPGCRVRGAEQAQTEEEYHVPHVPHGPSHRILCLVHGVRSNHGSGNAYLGLCMDERQGTHVD
ncbi:hypothetical protein RvY_19007-3 [Ramazzottius varieornatus]|uniref:Uncharacterized protein n=1 Tax=Ramazzottius varieornatus TaxID=947166 RepID=A0A1D1W7U9_RAMVA|nr:hypothetical protein RvY_19007-3 [Ramazzottius varieornatus]